MADSIGSNLDLMTEILVRLPAKSLIRFKCVAKDWLSLISQPKFCKNHCARHPRPTISGLYFYSFRGLQSVSLIGNHSLPSLSFIAGIEGHNSPQILKSCNGLMLLKVQLKDSSSLKPTYIVANVTTQKYKVLPKNISAQSAFHGSCGACLAFDPSKSPHYKVVIGSPCPGLEIDLYNSETGNWKKILPPNTSATIQAGGFFSNGAVYWLSGVWLGHGDGLVKFKVDSEEIIVSPFPGGFKASSPKAAYFGACGEGLILIERRPSYTMSCTTLELENDTCYSISNCDIDVKTMGPGFDDERYGGSHFYHVLCAVKGENSKKEECTLVVAIPGKVVTYEMKSEAVGFLHEVEVHEIYPRDVNGCAYPFMESLCPV